MKDQLNYLPGGGNEDVTDIKSAEIIRCKDCIHFIAESGEKDSLFGIPSVGSHCGRFMCVTTEGFRNGERSIDNTYFWCNENDFCSKGERCEHWVG